jgi:hypothetical protein
MLQGHLHNGTAAQAAQCLAPDQLLSLLLLLLLLSP